MQRSDWSAILGRRIPDVLLSCISRVLNQAIQGELVDDDGGANGLMNVSGIQI